jgi:hypothetical protein
LVGIGPHLSKRAFQSVFLAVDWNASVVLAFFALSCFGAFSSPFSPSSSLSSRASRYRYAMTALRNTVLPLGGLVDARYWMASEFETHPHGQGVSSSNQHVPQLCWHDIDIEASFTRWWIDHIASPPPATATCTTIASTGCNAAPTPKRITKPAAAAAGSTSSTRENSNGATEPIVRPKLDSVQQYLLPLVVVSASYNSLIEIVRNNHADNKVATHVGNYEADIVNCAEIGEDAEAHVNDHLDQQPLSGNTSYIGAEYWGKGERLEVSKLEPWLLSDILLPQQQLEQQQQQSEQQQPEQQQRSHHVCHHTNH